MSFSLGNGSIPFTIPLFLNNLYKLFHIPSAFDVPDRFLDIGLPEDDDDFVPVTRSRVELEPSAFFRHDFAGRDVSRYCVLGRAPILRHLRGAMAGGQVERQRKVEK